MKDTTIAVDLAKSVFEVAVARQPGKVAERHRLSRGRFSRFLAERAPATIVMEGAGRRISGAGRPRRRAGGSPQRDQLRFGRKVATSPSACLSTQERSVGSAPVSRRASGAFT